MYLKDLSLRGFKSFASATTLRFEPGITAVVGPNGSGKSNIVDALAWVMGEQGAKTLRGTSMEDVIFAGTSSRPPLGRAQVSLTIDNTDHALDIEYSEVTITRTIFRNGGSEYSINGTSCRLLDIQELLSDTGLGSQMHVIIGQGRLDSILRADPAGHRAFIEEAAGILKHRKRKERALRKLANTETNLSRLDDLLSEIHRQLGPLGRQARISRRADGIQIALRDAQSRLLAEDAVTLSSRRDTLRAELTKARGALVAQQRELVTIKSQIEQIESLSSTTSPEMRELNDGFNELTRVQERLRSLQSLAHERSESALGRIQQAVGDDSQMLRNRAEELEQQGKAQQQLIDDARLKFDRTTEERAGFEKHLASVRQTLNELRQSTQQRERQLSKLREMIAREQSALQLSQSRAKDFEGQIGNLRQQLGDLETRHTEMRAQSEHMDAQDLDDQLAKAQKSYEAAGLKLNEANERQRKINGRIISLQAKADALNDSLESRNASGALEKDDAIDVMGKLADFIHVKTGWEEPVAHALDVFANAVVVPDAEQIDRALQHVRDNNLGKAVLISPSSGTAVNESLGDFDTANPHQSGFGSLAQYISVRESSGADRQMAVSILQSVRMLLSDVAAVDSLEQARSAIHDGWQQAVTADGDVVNAVGASGGSSLSQSDLSLVSRRDAALKQVKEMDATLDELTTSVKHLSEEHSAARSTLESLRNKRTEVQLRLKQMRDSLNDLQRRITQFGHQIHDAETKSSQAHDDAHNHAVKLDDLQEALNEAERSSDGQASFDELGQREKSLEASLAKTREQEVTAKIAWNEAVSKAESLTRQSQMLRDNAKSADERRIRIQRKNAVLQTQSDNSLAVARATQQVINLVEAAVSSAQEKRDALQSAASEHDAQLKDLRARRDGKEPQVGALQQQEHALDIERERLATQFGQLTQKVSDELGLNLTELIDGFGPDKQIPVLDETGKPKLLDGSDEESRDDQPRESEDRSVKDGQISGADTQHATSPDERIMTIPYSREEQQSRLEKAQRDLARLGKVNPLAAEEYESLESRNAFLNKQRNDVTQSRDDLMSLVKNLDATMMDVFRTAFEDTAQAFTKVFSTLFPGGTGRLRLEDPDDLLHTGVIVEASPAGKRVKQLSLLSGGERSLTALALLFAIFTARPSPFYVMDEVEAALDDVNLTRLLNALQDLRSHAQLIVITHQQRTMSIADALYGITMRDDGVTAVISQKMSH
ncbi:AAA family ATPase [Bifidobacterium aquikefiri]|uniref:AAA family ATPase n=1 Tax=Bifidobacterium aquikefiri TaxID=1653207 RepID=UPI0023EFF888|nr:AAA family ATPase [Bifidobacterium aquikefiri]